MKLLFDFFPIALFFIAYKMEGIFVATAVAIAATIVQMSIVWYKNRKFENTHLITLALIVVFGGLTLILQDEMFIKWKPTVLNWLFGAVFFGSQYYGAKTITERMMGKNIALPIAIWIRLNISWVVFFVIMGFVNLYVVYNFDTDTWVNFKLFGMMGMTILFVVVQALFLTRHILPVKPSASNEE